MKTVMVAVLMAAGFAAQASEIKKSMITPDAFLSEVKQYISDMSGDKHQLFSGELADIGGECSVYVYRDSEGKDNIVLESENGIRIEAWVDKDYSVKVTTEGEPDDSFQKVYKFGFERINELVITHLSDAYDTVSLHTGSTTLECGAYY